jgi:septal ring factor EnvC (AmiA/AmiB activator)
MTPLRVFAAHSQWQGIVPSLKQKVDEIHARLDELSAIRRQIVKRQQELDDALAKAESNRAKLDCTRGRKSNKLKPYVVRKRQTSKQQSNNSLPRPKT